GLVVTGFTPTPTGFTASFNKPFNSADVYLYNSNLTTAADVIMTGNNNVNGIHGTLLIDPANQSLTFMATESYLQVKNRLGHPSDHGFNSVVLPDATYTVTLLSGTAAAANGFLDALGLGLDGQNNGGNANYTTTFTTNFQ